MKISLTNKQKQFIREAKQVWNFKIGAVRSGKSYEDVAFEIVNGIVERKGLSGLNVIIGVSKTTIERNVLQPMREIYTSAIVGNINSQNICTIAGEPVYCIGAEKGSQVAKIQGSSIKYCYGDEVAKWHQDVFVMLESRLDKAYSRFSGSANPEYPTHWLKEFIDREDLPIYVQHYTIFDNPFLPSEYVERLCKEYTGFWYDRLILGKWVMSEGLCYEALGKDQKSFVLTDYPEHMQVVIGVDFGGTVSAHTFVATGYYQGFKQIIVLESKRLEARGVSPTTLIDEFESFCIMVASKYKQQCMECYCDSAEQTLIQGIKDRALTMQGASVIVKNAKKRPIIDRIRLITRLLGEKRLYFLNTAQTSLNAMSSCVYDTRQGHQDERLDNGTTDIDSVDATEYTIEPFMKEILMNLEMSRR